MYELNAQTWEDEYAGYWTYDADGDTNHSAEQGVNMIYLGKGYGKGYGQKGKASSKGNYYKQRLVEREGMAAGEHQGLAEQRPQGR